MFECYQEDTFLIKKYSWHPSEIEHMATERYQLKYIYQNLLWPHINSSQALLPSPNIDLMELIFYLHTQHLTDVTWKWCFIFACFVSWKVLQVCFVIMWEGRSSYVFVSKVHSSILIRETYVKILIKTLNAACTFLNLFSGAAVLFSTFLVKSYSILENLFVTYFWITVIIEKYTNSFRCPKGSTAWKFLGALSDTETCLYSYRLCHIMLHEYLCIRGSFLCLFYYK